MADIVDEATRSRMMSGIRGKDTRPEIVLRQALHARGLRYRIHSTQLPGHPDLVFAKHRAVVFVHGCFWHRHAGCRYCTTPKTRTDFWQRKFSANIARDEAVVEALLDAGWRVATVWECSLRKTNLSKKAVDRLCDWLFSTFPRIDIGERPEDAST